MSNWMTSGSARLKAKQNNSFSRRARQRAAVVASDGPMLKETATLKRVPLNKPIQSKARRRYSYGNPITRRGVAVSIGSVVTYNQQHCDDGPYESTLPTYITTTKNVRSSNKSDILSSETCTSCNPMHIVPKRRIRDASSRHKYCSSNLKRSAIQTTTSNYNQNRWAESYAHHPTNTDQSLNRLSHHKRDSPHQNNHTNNNVCIDKALGVSYQLLSTHPLGRQSSYSDSAENLSLPGHNKKIDFQYDSQIPEESQHQETLGVTMYQSSGNPQSSFQDELFQNGIKRFQKLEEGPHNPNKSRIGSIEFATYDGIIDSPDLKSGYSASSNFKGYQQRRQKVVELPDWGDRTRWKKPKIDEALLEQPYQQNITSQLQSNAVISESTLSRRLSDITRDSNSLVGSYSASNHSGIRMFKRKRHGNTEVNLNESTRVRYLQSDEPTFEERGFSGDFDSLCSDSGCANENTDQSKLPESSLRFFDDQNEIDFSGNVLNTPMPPSTTIEPQSDQFGTQQMKIREDIGEGRLSIAGQSGSANFEKVEWQQTSTRTTGSDCLESLSFGNESVWTFFR